MTQKLARRYESSCVATYLGVWDLIRKIFASQETAVEHQFDAGSFSFNSTGSCQTCNGNGVVRRWLSNLAYEDQCPSCDGRRFKHEVLQVRYKGYTISGLLQLSVSEALALFEEYSNIRKMLRTLEDMGMGYVGLGQSLTTLSGGEAQRLKLARELGKNSKGKYLYVLDEPTVGLSYYDTEKLLAILNRLVANNHSVLVIEHDPYVLSYCDYLIELGPGGGSKGGEIIANGTPDDLRKNAHSAIGRFLES